MGDERLVLTDDEGNYYVFSREAVERARVTGPERLRLHQALEGAGDTTGFAFEIISPNQTFPDEPRLLLGSRFKVAGIIRSGPSPAVP